jgi:hypothetical protein
VTVPSEDGCWILDMEAMAKARAHRESWSSETLATQRETAIRIAESFFGGTFVDGHLPAHPHYGACTQTIAEMLDGVGLLDAYAARWRAAVPHLMRCRRRVDRELAMHLLGLYGTEHSPRLPEAQ